ncbi:P-loop containing nucleoside triphosphate hydrolase protein [Neocallimastix sp. 'constans']|jgi:kinesin family protein 5
MASRRPASADGGNNIRVVCRFRPQNAREIKEGGVNCVKIHEDGQTVSLESKDYPGTFTFDKIFDWNCTQKECFEYTALPIVGDVMRGYNGTIFAYGQTGSGKTFSMMGSDIDSDEYKGVIPRIIEAIFTTIMDAPSTIEFTVKVSFMEIYMERIRDLLNPTNDNLPIHEEKNRGVYVKGLLEVYVSSVQEVMEVMRRGTASRVVAFTNMNAESSRSHSIFVVTVNQKDLTNGTQKSGKIYLVDLAGSEKVGKTGATGQTLEEAKKINKSLSALGMVINALTDGKSSHIPYRDSKLTRILQESLGGNSRTTLIINCSPSSFNDTETLSTLRFGIRAKTIKNKAKINQELSVAELKALLTKHKKKLASMQTYIAALEGEITLWRSGTTVPKEQYVSFQKTGTGKYIDSVQSPNEVQSHVDIPSRAATPALPPLNDDEREEFLKREGEMSDQLTEKEKELKEARKIAEDLKEELTFLKERENQMSIDNKDMSSKVNEFKIQLEKITFENKETTIMMDSLKESNQELSKEVEDLKKQLIEAQSTRGDADYGKEKLKIQKISKMMAELAPSNLIDEKEKQLRAALSQLDGKPQEVTLPTTTEEIEKQYEELIEANKKASQQESLLNELVIKSTLLKEENSDLVKKQREMENRMNQLELEYEELLEKTIAEDEAGESRDENFVKELKEKLEKQYTQKKEAQQQEIDKYKDIISKKDEEITNLEQMSDELKQQTQNLQNALENLKKTANSNKPVDLTKKEEELEKIKQTMGQQLADFDTMKKKLMRDLQNRCEKVVELELSLDETREQYNTILRSSNNKTQQQKMTFLERNLEQLTNVQKQLVEQNSTLKKEIVVADRKLMARNERIQTLEHLLQDAQEKLTLQNQKFDTQLTAMRERLQEARAQNSNSNNSWMWNASRIAKPLRGGQNVPQDDFENRYANMAHYSDLDPNSNANKRSSWYINLLKKS